MRIKKWLIALVCYLLFTPVIHAEGAAKSDISVLLVTDAYMPEVPPVSRTAAVYLKLKNTTDSPLILTGAATSIAKHVMIHQTVESQGMVKMQHQSSIVIPPGGSLEFAPGGTHIMLMGLQKEPIPEVFEMNLIFENKANQSIQVNLRSRIRK